MQNIKKIILASFLSSLLFISNTYSNPVENAKLPKKIMIHGIKLQKISDLTHPENNGYLEREICFGDAVEKNNSYAILSLHRDKNRGGFTEARILIYIKELNISPTSFPLGEGHKRKYFSQRLKSLLSLPLEVLQNCNIRLVNGSYSW